MRTQVRSRTALDTAQVLSPDANHVWLLGSAVTLVLLGWVMITSASLDFSDYRYNNALHYFSRHSVYLAISLALATAVLYLPVNFWNRMASWLLLASFLLLAIILIPGVGYTANNATRWLALGPITVQVSEIAKIGVLVYLASYLVRQTELVRSHILGFINPMLVIMLLVALLLEQPDFGAVVVILTAALGMLFLGGVRIWQFTLLVAGAGAAVVMMVVSRQYRMDRLIAWLDPWSQAQDGGYQLVQSLIAFGRGEFLGLGLGNSIQKLFFLPEAHTDFVFAVLAEELGLLGCMAVLLFYAVMIASILRVAWRAEQAQNHFAAYMAYGIALIFSVQLFINVGVNTGLLPTKGLTLPFISYGGSSLIVSFIFIAMVLRIDYELRLQADEAEQRRGGVVSASATGRRGRHDH